MVEDNLTVWARSWPLAQLLYKRIHMVSGGERSSLLERPVVVAGSQRTRLCFCGC